MQTKSIKTILSEVKMFSSLEENELESLEKLSHIYQYKEGSTLFVEGEMSDSLMILVDGVVSIFKHDNKGNEIVIGYFKRYALLAEPATLRHTPLPSSASFKTDGAIMKIDINAFEELFMTHPRISYAIIQSILEKNNEEHKRLSEGETKLINFFIGVIMKESKGKYNPSSIIKYLNKKFNV